MALEFGAIERGFKRRLLDEHRKPEMIPSTTDIVHTRHKIRSIIALDYNPLPLIHPRSLSITNSRITSHSRFLLSWKMCFLSVPLSKTSPDSTTCMSFSKEFPVDATVLVRTWKRKKKRIKDKRLLVMSEKYLCHMMDYVCCHARI